MFSPAPLSYSTVVRLAVSQTDCLHASLFPGPGFVVFLLSRPHMLYSGDLPSFLVARASLCALAHGGCVYCLAWLYIAVVWGFRCKDFTILPWFPSYWLLSYDTPTHGLLLLLMVRAAPNLLQRERSTHVSLRSIAFVFVFVFPFIYIGLLEPREWTMQDRGGRGIRTPDSFKTRVMSDTRKIQKLERSE